jgi:hypothetical protein
MGESRLRIAAILVFALGAVLAGIGNTTGHHWLTAASFGLFALGALCFLRWRAAIRARVFAREEKTSKE